MWVTIPCIWWLNIDMDIGFKAVLLLLFLGNLQREKSQVSLYFWCTNGKKRRIICSLHSVLQHLSATATMTNPRWNELEGGHEAYSNFKWRGKIIHTHTERDTQIFTCVYREIPLWGSECGRLNSIKLPAVAGGRLLIALPDLSMNILIKYIPDMAAS